MPETDGGPTQGGQFAPPAAGPAATLQAVPGQTAVIAESPGKRVFRNALGLFLGGSVADLLNLVVHAQLVLMLGPAGYGQVAQAQASADLGEGVGSLGLNHVAPVHGVRHRADLGRFVGSLLTLRAAATALAFFAVLALAPFVSATSASIVRLTAVGVLASPILNSANALLLVHQENYRLAWVPGTMALLNIGALGIVLLTAPTLINIVAAMVGVKLVHAVLFGELVRRRYGLRYGFDWAIVKELARSGYRAGWVEIVVLLYQRASYFVLNGLGPAVLGMYALADKITNPLLRVTGPVCGSALPMFAELAALHRYAELRSFLRSTLTKLAGVLLVVGLLVFMAVPYVIRHWFSAYVGAIPIAFILYVGVCFMVFNGISVACLNGLGRFGIVAVIATINLGVYAVCAWLLVGSRGAVGAALATTIMEGVNMCMQMVLLSTLLRRLERENSGP